MSTYLEQQKPSCSTTIDATSLNTRQLNHKLREIAALNPSSIEIKNVCGQRYIGTDINKQIKIEIYGTPGNDLGAFLNGPRIVVYGNAQDGIGNTMDSGEIIIHGYAGDIVGLSARGGKIFIRDSVGYRAGIHMKEYNDKKPILVIGDTAQDFLAEYLAGGIILLLGHSLKENDTYNIKYVGTGMHGGVIYIRGNIEDYKLSREVDRVPLQEEDYKLLEQLITEYCTHFNFDKNSLLKRQFTKLVPNSLRPYGNLYAY